MNKERERDEEGARECRTEAAAMTDGAEPCTGSGGRVAGLGGHDWQPPLPCRNIDSRLVFCPFLFLLLFSFCLWR